MGEKIKVSLQKAITFVREVWVELGKVTWPSQSELKDSTVAVFVTVVFFSLFVFLLDLLFSKTLTLIF